MSINRKLRAMLVAGTVAAAMPVFVSCAGYVRGGGVGVGLTFVQREPPPMRAEVIAESPGNEYVWVNGYWAWRGNDYEWVSGRWMRPEGGRRVWEPAHWEHERRGWFFVEGHWR